MHRTRFTVAAMAALALLTTLAAGTTAAQTYPNKPVRLIVTYPPGGSSDLMGRVLGQKLSDLWGQQVIIESKPGAAGSIGMEFAARQSADGYSFVIGNFGPVAVNPILSKVPYDIQKDFLPVSMVCTGPNILVVNSAMPVKSVQELVAAAKKDAGKLNFGTSGPGSMSHLIGEMFKRSAQISIEGIQYKGGVLAVQDLLAGQVQMIFSDALPVMQHIRAGKLRPIVDRLNADLVKVLADPDLKKKYADLGVEPVSSTPEFFGDFIRTESARYAKVIKDAGITAN
jgi:tripartite-type tricarboxylate transporter receptor subunit TctC